MGENRSIYISPEYLRRIAIVVPAYNEELAISNVAQKLIQHFPEAEIVIVDDGSEDRTALLAKNTGVTVIRHERNLGYGAALRTGIESTTKEYVLFCDADGQHRVEDITKVIHAALENNFDMVVGARTRESHVSLVRRPGKWFLKIFSNFLANKKIPDLNSGLRIIRRDVILQFLHLMPQGFSFSSTSTFAILKSRYSLHYIPIVVNQRIGKSTVRQWKHGPQTLMLILRLTVLFEPLRVFLTASAGLLILTAISFIIDMLSDRSTGIGDTTILFSVSTLLVFLFGLLCDQVSSLRREHHNHK